MGLFIYQIIRLSDKEIILDANQAKLAEMAHFLHFLSEYTQIF